MLTALVAAIANTLSGSAFGALLRFLHSHPAEQMQDSFGSCRRHVQQSAALASAAFTFQPLDPTIHRIRDRRLQPSWARSTMPPSRPGIRVQRISSRLSPRSSRSSAGRMTTSYSRPLDLWIVITSDPGSVLWPRAGEQAIELFFQSRGILEIAGNLDVIESTQIGIRIVEVLRSIAASPGRPTHSRCAPPSHAATAALAEPARLENRVHASDALAAIATKRPRRRLQRIEPAAR